jgi:hypothetical protein
MMMAKVSNFADVILEDRGRDPIAPLVKVYYQTCKEQ